MVHPGSITAVILWENGHSGNVPFEKFEIQSQTDGEYLILDMSSLLGYVEAKSRKIQQYSLFVAPPPPPMFA